MQNIFIGFIFIFLDFNINLGSSKIGLLPNFIGYIIMIRGLTELSEESYQFMKAKPFVTGMAVYSAILYAMDLLGISVALGFIAYVLAFISTVISLYISYLMVQGVIYMEGKYDTILNGTSLKSTWTLLAVFELLGFFLLIIPIISILSLIISFIIALYFLYAFNKSKNSYYNLNK